MRKKKIICIYKITNLINDKIYIGQTLNFYRRKNEHCRNKKVNYNSHINNSILKYGKKNFKFEIIIEISNTLKIDNIKDILNNLEIYFIKYYKSNNNLFGYNIELGGNGNKGTTWTNERRLIHSLRMKGINNPNYKGISPTKDKFGKEHHSSKIVYRYDLKENIL